MKLDSGIYVVTLNNVELISINAQDSRVSDKALKANFKNIKVGKAKSLAARKKNYIKTFGVGNVNFYPIIITTEIDMLEKYLLQILDSKRKINKISNRKTEWLTGITKEEAVIIVLEAALQKNISFQSVI